MTSRGNEQKPIFRDNADRRLFLNTVAQVTSRFHWLCYGYCLMNNHYHLVIETPNGNLSKGMRQLNGIYTQAFNRRHGRVGHLFQGRFKAILVQKDSHFLEVCRYVVLNPVRAKSVNYPGEWSWSSYRATLGQAVVPDWLKTGEVLSHFGARRSLAQEKYRDYVREAIGAPTIWEGLKAQSILGTAGFAEALTDHVTGRNTIKEIPKEQRLLGRPSLKQLFNQTAKHKHNRDQLIAEAVYQHGYSQMEVAQYLDLHYSTISRLIHAHQTAKVKT
ncbi:MAG TPA: transposase [Candidatus Binatia bacterium]